MSESPASPNRTRFVVAGELLLLSALHVGTGEHRELEALKRVKPGTNTTETSEAASIARDHTCAPYLPGTTLKGLLRRIGKACLCPDAITALFGRSHDDQDRTMGAVFVRGGLKISLADAAGMPYAASAVKEIGPGVFLAPFSLMSLMLATYGMGTLGLDGEMRRSGGFREA